MNGRKKYALVVFGAVAFLALGIVLLVRVKEPFGGGRLLRQDPPRASASNLALPARADVGKGELSEEQVRLLFKQVTGNSLSDHATGLEGRYRRYYDPRDDEYFGGTTGYCTLPPEEAEEILARVKKQWEAVGTTEDEAPNHFTYHHEMPYAMAGGKVPVGARYLSLSRVDGAALRRTMNVDPVTGRIRFLESYGNQ